jgi:starch phosphorylase
MNGQTRVSHPLYHLLPRDIDGFDVLAELALDMRWAWNHASDEVWQRLDPALWHLTHNPWAILQTVARDRIKEVLADPLFRRRIDELRQEKRRAAETPAWYQQSYPQSPLSTAAFFSMEFMLSEALPIYAGGLGNVAGDQLMAASDLGVPLVGVGLLYQQGYFRQLIDRDGAQQAVFPYNDPGQLPIMPLRRANGEWLRLQLDVPDYPIWLRAWEVRVGKVMLYLLDSNDPANAPPYRGITSELYGGSPELRLMQELVLGIGGWQLLEALELRPEVCHLNEGHAAFGVLARAQGFMQRSGLPFETALAITRAGNLFTTHTAVAAGFDRYAPVLIERCLGGYAQERLGITVAELLALGRSVAGDPAEDFNMAYLAIRGSGAVNGVSRLHGAVSRRLFAPLFPRWPLAEIPVGHVTNGVHMPSWDSAPADDLWTECCGKERWLGPTDNLNRAIRCASDAKLWRFRARARQALVEYLRGRLCRPLATLDASPEASDETTALLDPAALTLGFARRFAVYKRPDLLLHDPARLRRLLTDTERPVQLILAGKAHPADTAGKAMIQRWMQFIRQPGIRPHVIFLGDYDVLLTQHLVQGVDVWLNTPRRPWEACGTSGMKVLVNGGLNLSELDGWWAEAYDPAVGWALGDGEEHDDDPAWDAAEAEALYDLLEREVIPEFYVRDVNGIPAAWVARIRESMARLTPRYSANRAVREYTEHYYLPAAAAYRRRSADRGTDGQRLMNRRRTLEQNWAALRFGEVRIDTIDGRHRFEIQVHLAGLDPDTVRVELYAEGGDGTPFRQEMVSTGRPADPAGLYLYRTAVPATRPAGDYTARIIPRCDGAAVPLEIGGILWQR